eukprot:scaffold159144_cov25-Tisochrysis_lutea.AAC.2
MSGGVGGGGSVAHPVLDSLAKPSSWWMCRPAGSPSSPDATGTLSSCFSRGRAVITVSRYPGAAAIGFCESQSVLSQRRPARCRNSAGSATALRRRKSSTSEAHAEKGSSEATLFPTSEIISQETSRESTLTSLSPIA